MKRSAYTITEIVVTLVVLSILVVSIIPLVGNVIDSAKKKVTEQNMRALEKAMIGDGENDPGFVGIMGRYPDDLSDLWTTKSASAAPYPSAPKDGWDYAFVEKKTAIDGWGNPIIYSKQTPTSVGYLLSWGPNGKLDDLIVISYDSIILPSGGDEIAIVLPRTDS